MERQDVTVSLRSDLLREARHLAVDKGLSLSGFLAELLEERLESRRLYEAAREREIRRMREGLPLGAGAW